MQDADEIRYRGVKRVKKELKGTRTEKNLMKLAGESEAFAKYTFFSEWPEEKGIIR